MIRRGRSGPAPAGPAKDGPPRPHTSALIWRYLLVDVDGTLLDSRGRLSPRVTAALREAVAAGMELVLATGRTYVSLMRITDGLPLPPFHLITNGGAVGLAPRGEAVRYARYLPAHIWPRIVAALEEEGLSTLVFSHHHPDPPLVYVSALEGSAHFNRYVGRNTPYFRVRAPLAGADIPNVVEVAALGAGPHFDRASGRVLRRFSRDTRNHSMVLTIEQGYGKVTEFFQAGTSKWQAFLALFPEAAAHPERVIAFGDEANDVEMVAEAGMGIAMGNAIPALKAVADRVTADHDHEGVAEALEALLN